MVAGRSMLVATPPGSTASPRLRGASIAAWCCRSRGAAQTRGPFHLTMDTNDTIETARAFADAVIVPVHTDGWAHFRQNASDLRMSFDTLGFGRRLRVLEPGVATAIA